MLKHTFTYTDYNDQQQTEDLYFNITKTELADHLDLKDQIEKLADRFSGPERNLTVPEITEILNLVKTFMKISYGVKSDDGKRFVKGDQVWEEFTQTAAYDQFLFSLFENAEKAITFLLEVVPQDLRTQVETELSTGGVIPAGVARPQDRQQKQIRAVQDVPLPAEETVTEDLDAKYGNLTTADITAMDPEEFLKYKEWALKR